MSQTWNMAQMYKCLFKRQSCIIYYEIILTMKSSWKSLYWCITTLGNDGFCFHCVLGETYKYWDAMAGVNWKVVRGVWASLSCCEKVFKFELHCPENQTKCLSSPCCMRTVTDGEKTGRQHSFEASDFGT